MLDIWKIRGKLMKSVPKFMQGVYRCAMRHALDAVTVGESQGDVLAQCQSVEVVFPHPEDVPLSPQPRRSGVQEGSDGQSRSLQQRSLG